MRFRFLNLVLSFLFSFNVLAKECGLEVALRNPKVANNSEFWQDYAKLKSTEDGQAVAALLKKYGVDHTPDLPVGNAPVGAVSSQKSLRIDIDRKAGKEISGLPPNLKGKVDEILSTLAKPGGIQEIRNNPGRYHYEKLSQFGNKAHSVRLNDGYRILFDLDDTGVVLRRVNKGQIHGN